MPSIGSEAAADTVAALGMVHQDLILNYRTLSWLLLCEPPSKERFGVVDAAPTPTPAPLRSAIRARAEIWVLRQGGAQWVSW